jgi:putative heme iron utilization protein
MIAIDPDVMELEVDGKLIKISFDHTLTDSEDAHRTLVAMLKSIPKSSC